MTNSAGNPTINRYDEYGIPRPGNVGRFGYTGQAYLAEIGMYYYRARMYSPTLGRFLQTDPIGHGGGMNLYAYVLNDPVNFTDPSGLDPPHIVTGSRLPARQDLGPGLCGGCSGFTGQAAGAFLGLSSGGSGGLIYVPGIPGSATGTGGTGPNQTVTVTLGTAGYFYFAGGFGGSSASSGMSHLASQEAQRGGEGERRQSCSAARNETGRIVQVYVNVNVGSVFGATASGGYFFNWSTGTHGYFITIGGLLGGGADVGGGVAIYRSLADMAGFTDSLHVGLDPVQGSLTFSDILLDPTLVAGSVGATFGAGVSGSRSYTFIFWCSPG